MAYPAKQKTPIWIDDDHLVFRGQMYRQVGFDDHVTKDGRAVKLRRLRSWCANCAEPFEFRVSMFSMSDPNRRCDRCKRPGSPVRNR